MTALKNKHKTKDVSRELGKALHCTWKKTILRFSVLSLCIRLLVMLPPLKEGCVSWERKFREERGGVACQKLLLP